MKNVTCHLKVVPGDAEGANDRVLREAQSSEFGDVLHVDVLVGSAVGFAHGLVAFRAFHERRQVGSVGFQIYVPGHGLLLLLRAWGHVGVLVVVVPTVILLF